MKLFIYATLKSKRILEQALGAKHNKKLIPTILYDWEESIDITSDDAWPTINPVHVGEVKGDIIEVNAEELNKLDKWESSYRRIKLKTEAEYAWAYQWRGNE